MRNKYIISFIAVWIIVVIVTVNPYTAFANNPPDQGRSSLSVSNQAPANGSSTINVQATLEDSSGNPDSGDTVSFSAPNDSSAVITPSSTSLNSSGQASFTITSTNAGTDNITVIDTTTNTTLADLGQVTFTGNTPNDTPTPTCSPVTTPVLTGATSSSPSEITLTWSDASGPVNNYILAYGTQSGKYIYGSQNIGDQGTTSYTVSSLTQGTTYYFAIQAANACSTSTMSNEISAVAGEGAVSPSSTDTSNTVSPTQESNSPSPQTSPSSAASPQVESFGSPTPPPTGGILGSIGKVLVVIILLILLGVAGFFVYKRYLKKFVMKKLKRYLQKQHETES